jgi:hypothetical protein
MKAFLGCFLWTEVCESSFIGYKNSAESFFFLGN